MKAGVIGELEVIGIFFCNLIFNLEFFNVSKSSVAYTVKKYREYKNLKTSERSGCPAKINNRDKRLLKRLSMQNPHNLCQEISAAFITSDNAKISKQSVCQSLLSLGLRSYVARKKPFLTRRMKQKKLLFAKENVSKPLEFWKKVFFSDETYIGISLGSVINRIIRFKSTNPLDALQIKPTIKHPLKIMI